MKKTVLAFAVAAAMGVPAVAAADTTLYGRFNVSLDRVDNGANKGTQLASNGSRIGVRGSEDLGGGLRGVFQMEAGFDATAGGGNLASRNTFAGVAGEFGEVRVGRHDTPYKISTLSLNFFADMIGDMHNLMGTVGNVRVISTDEIELTDSSNTSDTYTFDSAVNTGATAQFYQRPNNTILYITPNFEGLQAMASYTTDARTTGDQPSATSNDSDAYSLAVMYTNGPIFVTAAYERWNEWAGTDQDPTAWKIGGTYRIDDLTLAAAYERVDTKDMDGSRNSYHLGARYSIGQSYLMGSYTVAGDLDTADTGAKMWAVGAGHNFSRRTGVYAAYVQVDNDDAGVYGTAGTGKGKGVRVSAPGEKVTGFQVGLTHNF